MINLIGIFLTWDTLNASYFDASDILKAHEIILYLYELGYELLHFCRQSGVNVVTVNKTLVCIVEYQSCSKIHKSIKL